MFDVSFDEKTKELTTILDDIEVNLSSIQALAIVSVEGLPIVAKLPPQFEETILAAMVSAILSLGDQIATTLGKGTLKRTMIEGQSGVVVVTSAGSNAVLAASAGTDVKLGLLFHEMEAAAKSIAEVLDK